MTWLPVVAAAAVAAIGTWMVLDRSLSRIMLGLGLWGHAVLLLLLASGGPSGAAPIGRARELATRVVADPLVQALALTAIVITFAVTAFVLALAGASSADSGDDRVRDDIEDRRVAVQRGDADLPHHEPGPLPPERRAS